MTVPANNDQTVYLLSADELARYEVSDAYTTVAPWNVVQPGATNDQRFVVRDDRREAWELFPAHDRDGHGPRGSYTIAWRDVRTAEGQALIRESDYGAEILTARRVSVENGAPTGEPFTLQWERLPTSTTRAALEAWLQGERDRYRLYELYRGEV